MKRLIPVFCILYTFTLSAQPVVVDTAVQMSDGVTLDLLYARPQVNPPFEGFPAILFVHGFAGNKDAHRNDAKNFASLGAMAVSYSVRGQGASGGTFSFFTEDRILDDLREMIAFTKSLPNVNPDKIAVYGFSQGGLHAWSAAAYDMGVRTAVSFIANGRFEENWTQNNALNWLFGTTYTTTTVPIDPAIKQMVQAAINTGNIGDVRAYMQAHTTKPLETSVNTPVLMIFTTYDQYFNPSAGIRQFSRIPANKRMLLIPAGHGPSNNTEWNDYGGYVAGRWLLHHLLDELPDPNILSPDSAVQIYDAGTGELRTFALRDSARWLGTDRTPQTLHRKRLYFDTNSLGDTNPPDEGEQTIAYLVNLGSTPKKFRTEPLAEDFTIAPVPITASLTTDATAPSYQMNVQLYEINPSTNEAVQITRGHYHFPDNPAGSRDWMTFEFNAALHTVRAGHIIEARVHPGHAAITNLTNNFVFGPRDNGFTSIYFGGGTESWIELYSLNQPPVSVGEAPVAKSEELAIYPNPAGPASLSGSDVVTVQVNGSEAMNYEVRLYNQLGKVVASQRASGAVTRFNVADLPAGMYYVIASGGSEYRTSSVMLLR